MIPTVYKMSKRNRLGAPMQGATLHCGAGGCETCALLNADELPALPEGTIDARNIGNSLPRVVACSTLRPWRDQTHASFAWKAPLQIARNQFQRSGLCKQRGAVGMG
jgi:hypothetical protein